MPAVRVMEMLADEIVDVVAMGNLLVTAIGAMNMRGLMPTADVLRRALRRVGAAHPQDMLVNVTAVGVMQMPVMQIVDVALVLDRRVPTIGSMRVGVPCVDAVLRISHDHDHSLGHIDRQIDGDEKHSHTCAPSFSTDASCRAENDPGSSTNQSGTRPTDSRPLFRLSNPTSSWPTTRLPHAPADVASRPLPQLAVPATPVRLAPATGIALISESGGRREDRQKRILEGWRDAVYAGQYSAVLYDCANDSVAHWISRLGAKVPLTRLEFTVVVQARAEEIGTLAPPPTTTCRRRAVPTPTFRPHARSRSNPLEHPPLLCGFRQCSLRSRRSLTPRRLRRPRSGSAAIARSSAFRSLDRAADGDGVASPRGGGGPEAPPMPGNCSRVPDVSRAALTLPPD
jgi:hypothetical protein